MKLCPNCKTTYSDDSLLYCLSDGTNLISMLAAEKTIEMTATTNPIRFNVPSQASDPTVFSPRIQPPTENVKNGISLWLVVPLIGILLLSVAALTGYILLKPSEIAVSNSPTPTPTATATPNSETAALKEQLESLKKQIADQKTPVKNDSPVRPFPNDNPATPVIQTARANSPSDGFLALRSLPDSINGALLAKIPHGTNIEIIGCQKNVTQLTGKRRGRWCRTNYNGQNGWVFDAFLKY
ncbi:MAG: SH3 domain-containing protein [Pyrinomonadaceae bacterium]